MKIWWVLGLSMMASSAIAQNWKGVGELGLSLSRGNSRAENLNGKLGFSKEDDLWKLEGSLAALRAKGEIVVDGTEVFQLSANRFEAGASAGYKFSERSYWVGSVRVEDDDFASFTQQWTLGFGYGYKAIDNKATKLSFEVSPGYKRAKPIPVFAGTPPVRINDEWDSNAIARGKMDLSHQLTKTTALTETLLIESGQDNTFAQNELGLAVKISDSFALKTGFQVRYNSDNAAGAKKTDTLLTTNLVYSF